MRVPRRTGTLLVTALLAGTVMVPLAPAALAAPATAPSAARALAPSAVPFTAA
ncbi:hypothetical protein AB0N87_20010 [Streptomyces sp. NPDC093228]|uniref:hypothetical protein n=1 Tax=unclassified Streptomyces TaxID=2593676 RepID=UPI000B14FA6F|nr:MULTISPECIES: hypothetical protein [unclassified Streptomyces]MDX3263433.1 hypothetical protein [Streptomyces sp. MI02-2A]REE63379.1 hypothetical protein BX257_6023 [Streptomyces sp. 3212.3]